MQKSIWKEEQITERLDKNMKKFMRNCAIAALILFVVGLIMAAVAGTIQGRKVIEDVVTSVTGGKVNINLGSWDNFGITIGDKIMERVTDWDDKVDFDIEDNIHFDKEFQIFAGSMGKQQLGTDVRKLDIEAGGCKLSLAESADEYFYVEGENVGKAQGYVKDQALYIKSFKSGKFSIDDLNACSLTLYVPSGVAFDEIEIEAGAGKIEFIPIVATEVSVEVGAGDVSFSNLQAQKLELAVGMGSVNFEGMQVNDMDAEVGMGSLYMTGELLGDAKLECAMGSIALVLAGQEKDFNYSMEGAMGNISIGNEQFAGIAQERSIQNGAQKNIDAECAMGSIEITFAD